MLMQVTNGVSSRLTNPIAYTDGLAFGSGKCSSPLSVLTQKITLADEIDNNLGKIIDDSVADCIDDRLIIGFAAGSNDPYRLQHRVVYQQPGGTVLHFTKAAVAANLSVIADARDFKQAYQRMFALLTNLGWQDSGHVDCGASKNVERSVAEPLSSDELIVMIDRLIGNAENQAERRDLISQNEAHKYQLLNKGFYGSWTAVDHEKHLREKVPQNFATLAGEHNPYGVLVIQEPGYGLVKNQYIKTTGRPVFTATTAQWDKVIKQLCPLVIEQERMYAALADDLFSVIKILCAPGMPFFTDRTLDLAAIN